MKKGLKLLLESLDKTVNDIVGTTDLMKKGLKRRANPERAWGVRAVGTTDLMKKGLKRLETDTNPRGKGPRWNH